jgi:hypothetical protein
MQAAVGRLQGRPATPTRGEQPCGCRQLSQSASNWVVQNASPIHRDVRAYIGRPLGQPAHRSTFFCRMKWRWCWTRTEPRRRGRLGICGFSMASVSSVPGRGFAGAVLGTGWGVGHHAIGRCPLAFDLQQSHSPIYTYCNHNSWHFGYAHSCSTYGVTLQDNIADGARLRKPHT